MENIINHAKCISVPDIGSDGLFDLPGFRYAFLKHLQPGYESTSGAEIAETIESYREKQYSLLADHFRSHLDISELLKIMTIKEDKPLMV